MEYLAKQAYQSEHLVLWASGSLTLRRARRSTAREWLHPTTANRVLLAGGLHNSSSVSEFDPNQTRRLWDDGLA